MDSTPIGKDKIYVLGLAVIGGNLAAWMINVIRLLVANPASPILWSYLVAEAGAFVAVLWLARNYRRRRRLRKEVDGSDRSGRDDEH